MGYRELCNELHGSIAFDNLYADFDKLIDFLKAHRTWVQKLYNAKERFIRSKEISGYSTDVIGFYDESEREGRRQISFYYSSHFDDFIRSHYPELTKVPELIRFLERCREIQTPYEKLCYEVSAALDLDPLCIWQSHHPQMLFKVIKYLPSYAVTRPHYDGAAFSLFLDSTDNQSLLLAPYASSFTVDDFVSPIRRFNRELNQNSILLIPGTMLKEFSIYPTPHIVLPTGRIRYATIAFVMRPHNVAQKNEFSLLPYFNH